MGRRIPAGKKIYSIAYLLEKQPGALRKDPRYLPMRESLEGSQRLLALRFNRRCYTLLHRAVIAPENLEHFYRTYRLPRHPFFPLFLAVKKSYLDSRERARVEREELIRQTVDSLPPLVRTYWGAFIGWEESLGRRGAPLFRACLYPRTKKKAREYLSLSRGEWILLYRDYLERGKGKYGALGEKEGRRLLDRFALDLPPPPAPVDQGMVKSHYRRLSLEYHPDRGGDGEIFRLIGEARERVY